MARTLIVSDRHNSFFSANNIRVGNQIPVEGNYVKGDIIVNIGDNTASEAMWICVESGNPGIWEVVGAGARESSLISINDSVFVNEPVNEVSLAGLGGVSSKDKLTVHYNSVHLMEGVDYKIEENKIVKLTEGNWNENSEENALFAFELLKCVESIDGDKIVVDSKLASITNHVVIENACSEVEIGIEGFNAGNDMMLVFKNGVNMVEGIDYEVQDGKIVSTGEVWNENGIEDYGMTFIVFKELVRYNDINTGVIEMEHLSNDVKNIIEAAGNIDLSGYQGKNDDNLATTDKTIVGAINELFQNVSNGKNLIAEALTDRGVDASATETFVELANKILSIPQGIELPMKSPSWTANIDTVTATLDTQDNLFTQFRVNEGAWQTSNVFSGLTGGTTYKFEGMYGASRISSISSISPKANQSAPGVCTASNITQTSVTITAPSGCMIRYNGANYSSPKTFTGVASSYHDFYAYKPATANKNESPVSSALNVRLRGLGLNSPGPEHLIKGTATEGYFGTVNISTKGGLVDKVIEAGLKSYVTTSDTTPVTFLKFIQNGKFIYIAKTPFYYETSGSDRIYSLLDFDKWADGTMSTTATIEGRNYVVRAPKIGNPLSQTLTYEDSAYSTGFDYNLFVLAWSEFAMPAAYFIPTANRVTIQYGETDREFVMLYTSGHSVSFWSGSTTNMGYVLPVLELQ